jgi:signal transduction histidine kinase
VTTRWWRHPELWAITGAVAALTAGHYAASTSDPFWHDLFRRLYYLPIVLAGFRYGLVGGIAAAAVVSAVFVPHVLMTQHLLHGQALEARFEIPLYFIVGSITGLLAGRVRRAERFRALGEMAATMAHEVKNPLAAIRSSAESLGGRLAGTDGERARIIVGEADRLNRVVNDFLLYARPLPPRRLSLKLGPLLDNCLELLGGMLAERHVTLTHSFPRTEPDLRLDPDQFRQVFLNLLINAIEAGGTTIGVTVSVSDSAVTASISDNGPGIEPARLHRVFEPFHSDKAGGTGLGLAVARRIVTEHGGRLWLESTPGSGTTARVQLPQARPQ